MRLFEWLVLLSFVPLLATPLLPARWRGEWLPVTVALPVLACAVHVVAEGWRSQMAPLYLLALVVLAVRLPALAGRRVAAPRWLALLVSAAMAVLVVLGGLLAGWLLPVISLPEPTGPHHVGIVEREVDAGSGRRLMTSVWYPAATDGPPAPLTRHPDEIAAALGNLTGLPAPVFQHLRYVTLAASDGVPALAEGGPLPVLVFSHGLVGVRLQNSPTLQDLASWGYVVVAIDHTDAAAVTVFPDGETRFYDPERFGIPAGENPDAVMVEEHMFPVWVADQRAVYDELDVWNEDDPVLAGRLDLTRVGSFGHSFGGATALDVCLSDPRCGAALDLDGGLYGESVATPAVRPLMLMTSADSGANAAANEKWRGLAENAGDAFYWLELPNSSHLSFTFTELLSPVLVPQGFDPRAGLATVDAHVRAFFDAHLRGEDAPLLDPASPSPGVRWIAR